MDTFELEKKILENALSQSTLECRENYLKSCENHGGVIADVVKKIRESLK